MCLALIVSWPGFLQTASDLQVDLSAFAVSCRRSLTSDGLATAWVVLDRSTASLGSTLGSLRMG